MALLRINACGDRPRPHHGTEPLADTLAAVLTRPGPVIVMLHGFRYGPGKAGHCPHDGLFATGGALAGRQVVSWPQRLGLDVDPEPNADLELGPNLEPAPRGTAPGIGVAFGWDGRGTIRGAYRRAAQAGRALARLVRAIRRIDPTREVHVLAHSMGARVALQALAALSPGDMSRLILMAAAEYRTVAAAALATPAGRSAQVVHVTSRENDLYDWLLEWLVPGTERGDRALGPHAAGPNMRSLLIDDPATLSALGELGFDIAPAARRICHWSPYLRSGVFTLYRALLTGGVSPQDLDRVLPSPEDGRWRRLWPNLALPGLSFAAKAPS